MHGGRELPAGDRDGQLLRPGHRDLLAGNRNYVREGSYDGDLLGDGLSNAAEYFHVHVHDLGNRWSVAGDHVSRKHRGEREFAWFGVGYSDLHYADTNG